MKNPIFIVFLVLVGFFAVSGIEIHLNDGRVFQGSIVSETTDFFLIRVGSSDVKIDKSRVIKKDGVFYAGSVRPRPATRDTPKTTADNTVAPLPETTRLHTPGTVWMVKLKNGSIVCGKRISENDRIIVLDTDGFIQSIFKNTIVSIDSGTFHAASQPDKPETADMQKPPRRIPDKSAFPGASSYPSERKTVEPKSVLPFNKDTGSNNQPESSGNGTAGIPMPKPRVNVVSVSADGNRNKENSPPPTTEPETVSTQAKQATPDTVLSSPEVASVVGSVRLIPSPKSAFQTQQSIGRENFAPGSSENGGIITSSSSVHSPSVVKPASFSSAAAVSSRVTGSEKNRNVPEPKREGAVVSSTQRGEVQKSMPPPLPVAFQEK